MPQLGQPGDLNHVIALQRRVQTKDSGGGNIVNWTTFDTVCGSAEALSYREALQTEAVTATLLTAITIYYRTDLSTTNRVLLEGRQLAIVSLQDQTGEREYLRLLCSEVAA
jgi:SPP1 family predicted phage head-tail adaptor